MCVYPLTCMLIMSIKSWWNRVILLKIESDNLRTSSVQPKFLHTMQIYIAFLKLIESSIFCWSYIEWSPVFALSGQTSGSNKTHNKVTQYYVFRFFVRNDRPMLHGIIYIYCVFLQK